MAQRSQVIIFQNLTASTLQLVDSDVGGQWTQSNALGQSGSSLAATWFSSPPDTIAPGAIVAWGSESKDLPPTPLTLFGGGSGTGGHAHYSLPAQNGVLLDKDDVWIEWDVPYMSRVPFAFVDLPENTVGFAVMLNLNDIPPGGISKTHQIEGGPIQGFGGNVQYFPTPGGAGVGVFATDDQHPTAELSLRAIGSASDALTVDFRVPQILSWVANHPGPDVA